MRFKIDMFTDHSTFNDKTVIANNKNEAYRIVNSHKQKLEILNVNSAYN